MNGRKARTQRRLIELKKSRGKYVNFSSFRVCFVFVSCFDLGFSCLYRYTRNAKHDVFMFRVPNSGIELSIRSITFPSFTDLVNANVDYENWNCLNIMAKIWGVIDKINGFILSLKTLKWGLNVVPQNSMGA